MCVCVLWGWGDLTRDRSSPTPFWREPRKRFGYRCTSTPPPPPPPPPPSLPPSSFGLNCLSHVLSLSVGRELSFYTCTFLSNIRGALSSRQSVCTTDTWTNIDTKKEPKAGQNSWVDMWRERKLRCFVELCTQCSNSDILFKVRACFIWSPIAKNFQISLEEKWNHLFWKGNETENDDYIHAHTP